MQEDRSIDRNLSQYHDEDGILLYKLDTVANELIDVNLMATANDYWLRNNFLLSSCFLHFSFIRLSFDER